MRRRRDQLATGKRPQQKKSDMEPGMQRNSDLLGNRHVANLFVALRAIAVIASIGIALLGVARAQQPAPAMASGLGGMEVLATPYLWLPWTSTTVHPRNSRISSASGTIDPGELIDHLTWVPFMGSVEFRSGPFGALFDYVHAPLKSGITTKDIIFGGGGAGVGIDTGTAMWLYRAMAAPNQYVDIGIGMRAWGLGGDISLSGKRRRVPDVSLTNGVSWADPMIGARYHFDLGNGYGATAYGDVGGFGLGAHIDWQLIGTIDYTYNSWIDLHVGFRSLNFNFTAPRTGLNVNMYGPIIAATLRF